MRRDMGNLKFNYEHENNCNFIVLEEEDNVTEDYLYCFHFGLVPWK